MKTTIKRIFKVTIEFIRELPSAAHWAIFH